MSEILPFPSSKSLGEFADKVAQAPNHEINHLLGPGQTAQIPVNDDAVEAVIDQG
jgi:hypothetical protein